VSACTFGAMTMREDGIPLVDPEKCTACGDCVDACPKGLFSLMPVDRKLLVQCRNLVSGDDALEECRVACTACGKCVVDGAPGLISIASGVAVIDYDLNALADPRATARCPTGAIVWLEGAQFAPARAPALTTRASAAPRFTGRLT
jgi:Fe-S-cluster-containing hydrogenase component 2